MCLFAFAVPPGHRRRGSKGVVTRFWVMHERFLHPRCLWHMAGPFSCSGGEWRLVFPPHGQAMLRMMDL